MNKSVNDIDFREKLKKIKRMGFIKSLRKNNTGIGYTIEELLGVRENNSKIYDFKNGELQIELKAKRIGTSSRVTLFTKSPEWKPTSAEQIIRNYGKLDSKGRLSVKVTLNNKKFNSRDMMLEINEEKDRLEILHKTNGVLCYFSLSDLLGTMDNKLKNLLLVFADRKLSDDFEEFHYKEAYLFKNFSKTKFMELLKNSKIVWEFRMDIRKRNQKGNEYVRDHGSGFRINQKFIDSIYESKEKAL